jgi:hypothetical protein
MERAQIMSVHEIHDFGIEVVATYLKKEGYVIDGVNPKIGVNPQIIARKAGVLAFIAVRTACYPEKGMLETNEHFQMIDFSDSHQATPYFASVGICNADGKTEKEMSIPIKGAGFHISFEGLLIIARSDRVRILGNEA